jgi:hypothetical protein
MKFLMLIRHPENFQRQDIPQALIDAMATFVGAAVKRGVVIDTAPLQPTAAGSRVRTGDGALKVTDGPFVETKEVVGGYFLVELPSRREALEFGRGFMELHRVNWPSFHGECEIRPIEIWP